MGPEIHLNEVGLRVGRNEILRPFSTQLDPGKVHLLMGPNGAGKSSLLKCLLGLQPHQGEIQLHWPSKEARVKPAYIPQQAVFDAALPISVADFMRGTIDRWPLFSWRRQNIETQIHELLCQVGMENKHHLRLDQLSGGERQRLLFARALHQPPGFWCLDEPMTGLDSHAQAIITRLILEQRDKGATIVMVHHGLDFARQHADQILLINEGLSWQGPAVELPDDLRPQSVSATLCSSHDPSLIP